MSKARRQRVIHSPSNSNEGRVGLVYARVSSKRQEVEGSGLESQEGRCIKELARLGVTHDKTFLDSASGGGDFLNRPAMKALLEYIDTNPHKKFVLIFDDLSRFARDVFFHIKLRAEFRKRDVTLKCLNYNFDESEEGEFAELIFAGKAELDRKQNRRQVIQKQKSRLEMGYWAFGARKGYKMHKNPIHGKILTPKEPEAEILSQALNGFANGTFPRLIDACRFLVAQGFWTKQSPEKYIDKFKEIVMDSVYAGYIEYPAWEVARRKGHHEALISSEVFELNQKRLRNVTFAKRIRIDISSDFPLRGLLACSECQSQITSAWSKGRTKSYAYYMCHNKKCSCYGKSIPKDLIEKQFKVLLKKHKLRKEISDVIGCVFESVWQEEKKLVELNLSQHDAKIDELKRQASDLTKLILSTKTETVQRAYENQLELVQEELEKLENASGRVIDWDIPYRTALDKSTKLLRSPYSIWTSLDVLEQQKAFPFLFEEKLQYSKKAGYRTDKILSTTMLFEEFVATNSLDVEMVEIESTSENDRQHVSTVCSIPFNLNIYRKK